MIPHPNFPSANIDKVFSQTELDELLAKHQLWVENSPEGERAYLAYATFDGLDFSNKTITNLGFEGSSLVGCNFDNATISHSSFRGAKFIDADFTNAQVNISNFISADLTNASLTGSKFASFGDARYIKNISVVKYLMTYTHTHLGFDCMWFEIDWWRNATLEEVQALVPNDQEIELMYSLLQTVGLPAIEKSPALAYRV